MSYESVDPKRLQYLLATGTEPGEIAEFLKSCKKQLIAAGTALHRVSDKREAQISLLASLNGKSARVLAAWMRKRLKVEESIPPETLVAQYHALESAGSKNDRSLAHAYARLGLYYLFKESPPAVWITFLKQPIDSEKDTGQPSDTSTVQANSGKTSAIAAPEQNTSVVPDDQDIQAIAAACDGRLGAQSNLNIWAATCAAIVTLLRRPDADAAEVLKTVPDEAVRNRIAGLLGELRKNWQRRSLDGRGLLVRDPRPVVQLGEIEVEGAQVLGRCSKETVSGTAAFVEPYALLIGSELWSLDRNTARELFPERGQIIGFPGPAYPMVGELATWVVETFESEQPIKLRIRSRGVSAFTVIDIPVPSTEPDAIREALKSGWPSPVTGLLFRLSDGLLIKAPGEGRDYLRYNYDTPLLAWHSATGWRVSGQVVVLGPLPPHDTQLDCSDLGTVLKNVLEDASEVESWPQLSRGHVRIIVEYIRTQGGLSEKRLKRLEAELDAFVDKKEGLENVVSLVLKSDKVKAEVDAAKQKVVEDFEASRSELLEARGRLEEHIKQLNTACTRLEEQKKQIASEVGSSVRKAFDKAKAHGLEAVSEFAVFEALFEARERGPEVKPTTSSETTSVSVTLETIPREPGDLPAILKANGINVADSHSIARLVLRALPTGIPVALTGNGASYVVTRIAQTVSQRSCAVIDVGVGLYHSKQFTGVLESIPSDADVVVIRGANCSDFTVYGTSIEAVILDRLSGSRPDARTLLFAFAEGPSSLPIPAFLLETCLLIDITWLNEGRRADDVLFAELAEGLECARRSGAGRLKLDRMKAILAACQEGEGIGTAAATILFRNLEEGTLKETKRVLDGAAD